MLKCFEHWFGPYPWYDDGYKLVETPHLGMEHQSAVAYGNHYRNGYLGRDLSGTGWGLKWDFIIVHESAHEWFGNNITTRDIADFVPAAARSGLVARALGKLQFTDVDPAWLAGFPRDTRGHSPIKAIDALFAGGTRPPVTAVKGATGHLIGGSGALEAIVTMWSVRERLVPPVSGLRRLDPALPVDPVCEVPRRIGRGHGLTNSFGFGGTNACLVLRAL